MRLVFQDPEHPGSRLIVADRTDSGNPIVLHGQTFEVNDSRGQEMLDLEPRLRERKRRQAAASPSKKPAAAKN